jgi:DNA invertase Pin-like site-specific DNA recombinase
MVGAVIYVRVSTKEQTENLSLPTQLCACEKYCRRQGYEVLERFHEEGESAKSTDRSQLQNLLTFCRLNKGRVHFVVVFNLTRFARDKHDHFALRSHLQSLGISLRSATEPIDDTSTGKLMEGVLAAFAQFDNDCRSDRTRAGMKAALELGRWVFLAPLGYINAPRAMGKSLVPDPERAPLVRRAFEEYATGRFTKQELLQQATTWGLRNRRGRSLSSQAIGMLLRNQLYAGIVDVPEYGMPGRPRRLRAGDPGEPVLSRPGRALRPRADRGSKAPQPPGLPAAQLRALRDMRTRTDGKLVEGTERLLPVLPLPTRMQRGERGQGEARGVVHRRAREAAAEPWIHAAAEGVGPAGLEGTQGVSPGRPREYRAEGQGDSGEARSPRRGVPVRALDRHRHLRPSRRETARGVTLVRIDRHSGQLDELDVEGILAFAERVLPRAADLWVQASLEQRQRFQQLFFPDGIAFNGNGFVGTAVTAPAFSYLRTIEDGNERMVAQISPRWNSLTSWMRQIEDFQRAA